MQRRTAFQAAASPTPTNSRSAAVHTVILAAATGRRTLCTPVRASAGQINPSIKKDVDKVVDMAKVDELPKKAVFCRCWRSETFPYCNGAHVKHNKETGDNVGPLIVEKAQ
eukprot:GHUV01018415.1.p3 GENE.GHUV01018415.1~~GHUV01018415.1.p3  ORF type:complete len:111 (+),score=33.92 GHUV01018415.1:347-679(+)